MLIVGANPLAIYKYDPDSSQANKISFLDFIFNYKSLLWNAKLNDYAECEIWVELSERYKQEIVPGNIIYRDKWRCFVITFVEYIRDETGILSIHAKGYTMAYFLTYRVLDGTYSYSNFTISMIVDILIAHTFGNAGSMRAYRNTVNIEYVPNTDITTQALSSYIQTGGTLLEALQELVSKQDALCFDVYFDNTTSHICIKLYLGDNTQYPKVAFDDLTSSIVSSNYSLDISGTKNVAYVYGEDTGTQRKSSIVYSPTDTNYTGLSRRELYIDARDIQSEAYGPDGRQIQIGSAEYTVMLNSRGYTKLDRYEKIENYTANIRDNDLHRFGSEYTLGDNVLVIDHMLGVEAVEKVTGFVETESAESGTVFTATIGQERVTIKKCIERLIK